MPGDAWCPVTHVCLLSLATLQQRMERLCMHALACVLACWRTMRLSRFVCHRQQCQLPQLRVVYSWCLSFVFLIPTPSCGSVDVAEAHCVCFVVVTVAVIVGVSCVCCGTVERPGGVCRGQVRH
jgi:hypothetical protein